MKNNHLLMKHWFYCLHHNAQELTVNWSDKELYDNKADGFFESFVGSNSKYIYVKYGNLSRKKKINKIELVVFDKKSMKKMDKSFKSEETGSVQLYKGLNDYKTIVFENLIYVFWMKESKYKDELFVQSLDNKLNPLNSLKKYMS